MLYEMFLKTPVVSPEGHKEVVNIFSLVFLTKFILSITCPPPNECCGECGHGCPGEYSWLQWNDRLLAIKSILVGFISIFSDFGIVFSWLCLVPSYTKEFCNLSWWTRATEMQISCQMLGCRNSWANIVGSESRGEWVSWNPNACCI